MGDVKRLRERFGLSREQFCDAFDIPYRTLQSWELGTRSCPVYVYRMMKMLLTLSELHGTLEAFKNGVVDDAE
jgi:DNA-binding transcriptional regulator YiaG